MYKCNQLYGDNNNVGVVWLDKLGQSNKLCSQEGVGYIMSEV